MALIFPLGAKRPPQLRQIAGRIIGSAGNAEIAGGEHPRRAGDFVSIFFTDQAAEIL